MSLRTRIAAVASLAVALAVVAVAVAVYVGVRSELRGEVERSLTQRADGIVRAEEHRGERPDRPPFGGPPGPGGPGQPGPPDLQTGADVPFGGAAGYAQFVSTAGRLRAPPDAAAAIPVDDTVRAIARRGRGEALEDRTVKGIHLLVLTRGIGPRGAIQVARPLDEVDRELDRVLLILVIVGLAGIALAAGLGTVVARAALAPIGRFTRRTEALTTEPNLSERMEVVGKDELARLATSFNTTLDALERSVESQRHLIADASHELRTPIASLRANVQVLEDAARLPADERESLRADIISELDELTALVGDVVELARGAKPEEALDDIRLDHVVTSLVERAERRATDGVTFDVSVEPALVRGESDRVSRAISNLLDNARKWSPEGGTITVELAGGTLTVRDEGPGFEPGDLPHVFERFYRTEQARAMPGSGLGLAIVRQAAEAHGGRVEAANAPGGGALLRVAFGPVLEMAPLTELRRSS